MSDCSTHAFDVPLRECPFCGGEAEKLTSIDGFTSIGCLNCNPFYGVMIQRITEAEAIAAWNSRAERTCKIIEWHEARDRHEIGNNRVRFSCGDFGTCHDKFCPECGARVVGE